MTESELREIARQTLAEYLKRPPTDFDQARTNQASLAVQVLQLPQRFDENGAEEPERA